MRVKNFSFSLSEDAHKSCKKNDDLANLYTGPISDRLQSTIHDIRRSVENMSQNTAEIKQLPTFSSL